MSAPGRTNKPRFEPVARFFSELRRRKVIRVAGAYAIVGWIVIQIGSNTFEALHLPPWALTLVIVLTALGFPIALVIAWSVELTPSGIRAEQPAPSSSGALPPPRSDTGGLVRNALVSQPAPRRSRVVRPQDPVEAVPAQSVTAGRVQATRLRHDLRTPMNAVLGYAEVLVSEAAELGLEPFVPQLRELHEHAKHVLDRINEAVPASAAGSGEDAAAIRANAHAKLDAPSRALLAEAQALLATAGANEAARTDLERLLSAVSKLAGFVAGLAAEEAGNPADAPQQEIEAALRHLRPAAHARADGAGAVLVVDDNALNRDLVMRQLVREGYNVQAVASGAAALETLRVREFDLVLLDVVMPEMDGVELLDRLQADAALSDIPVVMMSALDEIEGVARCLEKGAADYLTKPLDPVLLRARVRSTLQIRRLRDDLRHAEQRLDESAAARWRLASSIAPQFIARRIERGELPASVQYPEVTAVVARVEGVDAIAARTPSEVGMLFAHALDLFERCSSEQGHALTRVTDRSFTAIAGAPDWSERHVDAAMELALALARAFESERAAELNHLQLRIGIHTGALTAGMAGNDRLVLGLWGDAVATADAIAACAPFGQIRVSNATAARLEGRYVLDEPLVLDMPGRGQLPTRSLRGVAAPS